MKGFALIVCVFSLAVFVNGNAHDECQADPATRIDLEQLRKTHGADSVAKLSAHSYCMTKKLGFQKDNGDVDKAGIRNRISTIISDEAKLNEAVEKCGEQKASPEETASHIMRCFHEYGDHLHGQHHGGHQHHH